jgi:hypothetical protein
MSRSLPPDPLCRGCSGQQRGYAYAEGTRQDMLLEDSAQGNVSTIQYQLSRLKSSPPHPVKFSLSHLPLHHTCSTPSSRSLVGPVTAFPFDSGYFAPSRSDSPLNFEPQRGCCRRLGLHWSLLPSLAARVFEATASPSTSVSLPRQLLQVKTPSTRLGRLDHRFARFGVSNLPFLLRIFRLRLISLIFLKLYARPTRQHAGHSTARPS